MAEHRERAGVDRQDGRPQCREALGPRQIEEPGEQRGPEPAPRVELTSATSAAADPGTRRRANPQPAPAAAASSDSGSPDTLSIVALIVGVVGLLVAGVAVAMARGSRSAVR